MMIMSKSLEIDDLHKISNILKDAVRRARWSPPSAAIVPNFHLPMRSYEVKNRTSTDDIKALRLITAIKTPYLPDGRFDLEAYDSLVNMHGADGVIVGGTTSEGQLMSWDEHIMLIGHTSNCFGTAIKVIGNTGSNSTREAVHATEQGFAVGMHAALHINPYYGKTSLEGMVAEDAVRESIEKQVPSVIMKAGGIAPRWHPATIVYVPDTLDPIMCLNVKLEAPLGGSVCYPVSIRRPNVKPEPTLGVSAFDPDSAYLLEPLLGGSVCYPVSIMRPNVKPEPPLGVSAFDLDSANDFNEIRPEPPLGVLDIYLKCRGTCYQDPICSTISFTRDTLIPSWCHDITRVVVLPRAAQIFWRPKSKFKIRTLYIFVGKLIFL